MGAFIVPIQPMEKMEFSKPAGTAAAPAAGASFENFLQDAMQTLEETMQASEADGSALALGDVNDLAQLQINSMKAQAMLQTTVQLTTRAVNAYKEIMQMQV